MYISKLNKLYLLYSNAMWKVHYGYSDINTYSKAHPDQEQILGFGNRLVVTSEQQIVRGFICKSPNAILQTTQW